VRRCWAGSSGGSRTWCRKESNARCKNLAPAARSPSPGARRRHRPNIVLGKRSHRRKALLSLWFGSCKSPPVRLRGRPMYLGMRRSLLWSEGEAADSPVGAPVRALATAASPRPRIRSRFLLPPRQWPTRKTPTFAASAVETWSTSVGNLRFHCIHAGVGPRPPLAHARLVSS